MISSKLSVVLGLLALPGAWATSYSMVQEYAGTTFFDGWDFYGNYDNLTNGDAIFVDANQAQSLKLAYVNDAGNAIIKVDNASTVAYNDKRNTIRINTKDRYEVGSVWITDMLHVPFGCSVWPAWWSQAPHWPVGGEIDTFEGVNQVTMNQMTLHTEPGCTQVNPVQSSTLVNSTDCSFQANSNQGCVVTTPSPQSYGEAFAQAGGGMFVTEYASSGISIWFFSRSSIPSSLQSNASSVDTSALGTPVANWPTGGCNIGNFFQAQSLIFDITLCGDFAGNAATFAQTCSGTCYPDYVVGNGSTYDNAYFEVQYVRVYGANGQNTTISAAPLSISRPSTKAVAGVAAAAAVLGLAAW
ncbi:glycoside hydrolase family 16 protein [Neolentinus lepideus HHB14362 ss-1]|uniref:Glycoside hydrolase family 16 protein n=1 Tax=Neolentinus lepideus HHB14362 ss-1 TaxID=1314782 RepID=A0A165UVL6_9AGAM|nr:glycoside hydrolase family 16 protein [Neolentinus lepideus HHB14362 ss-1]